MTEAAPAKARHYPIVIAGGGFAGAYCAKYLAKHFGKEASKQAALIADQNVLTFQPMLAEVVGASLSPLDVVNPLRLFCRGTNVLQGRITEIQRGGRIKGRAQVLMHFTTLIYPSGYTVILPGAVENAPGADKTGVKDEEGTLQKDGQTGSKVGTVATTAGAGAVVGGLSRGGEGALIGAGVGVATILAMNGNHVHLNAGNTVEAVLDQPLAVDPRYLP